LNGHSRRRIVRRGARILRTQVLGFFLRSGSRIVLGFEAKRRGARLLWIDRTHGIQTEDSSRPLHFAYRQVFCPGTAWRRESALSRTGSCKHGRRSRSGAYRLQLLELSSKILGSLPVPFNLPVFCRMAARRATGMERSGNRGSLVSQLRPCPVAREQPTIKQLPTGETS